MADSWLTDGNCNECRRKNYCTKGCKKNKLRKERFVRDVVMNSSSMGKIMRFKI